MSQKCETTFLEGDIVFVKLKGHPFWPAKVVSIVTKDNCKIPIYSVHFFGDYTTAHVKQTNMVPYAENKQTYGQPKTENYKHRTFNKALKEADIEYNNSLRETKSKLVPNLAKETPVSEPKIGNLSIEEALIKVTSYEQEEVDIDTSLSLAAEIGNSLLAANSKLEQEINILINENLNLVSQNNSLKSENTNILTESEEELKNREEIVCSLMEKNGRLEQELEFVKRKLDIEFRLKEDLIKTNEQEKIFFNDQIISRDNKIMQYEKEIKQHCEMKNRQEINPNDSLLNYHRKYPNDSFRTLAKRLETDVQLYKNDAQALQLENQNLKIELKDLREIVKVLNNELSQTVTNCSTCYPPLSNPVQLPKSYWEKPKKTGKPVEELQEYSVTINNKYNSLSQINEESLTGNFNNNKKLTTSNYDLNKSRAMFISDANRQKKRMKYTGNKLGNILLLSDSNGRKCSQILAEYVGVKFKVSSIVKPNAKFNDVVKDVEKLTRNLTYRDHVVVMAGTNNFSDQIPHISDFNLRAFEVASKRTNITFTGIPLRYDRPDCNKNIIQTNMIIKQNLSLLAKNNSHITVTNNFRTNRNDFTKHGLHLNYNGKKKVCENIYKTIFYQHNKIQSIYQSEEDNNQLSQTGKGATAKDATPSSPIYSETLHTLRVGALDQSVDIMVHHPANHTSDLTPGPSPIQEDVDDPHHPESSLPTTFQQSTPTHHKFLQSTTAISTYPKLNTQKKHFLGRTFKPLINQLNKGGQIN